MEQPSEADIDELLLDLITHAQEYAVVFDFSTNEGIIDYILQGAIPRFAEKYRLQEEFTSLARSIAKEPSHRYLASRHRRSYETADREEPLRGMLSGLDNKVLFYAQALLSLLHPEGIKNPLDQFKLPNGDYLPTIYVERLRTLAVKPTG